MGVLEIVVEPTNGRRRRNRQSLAGTKRAAALFRVWHGVRELIGRGRAAGRQRAGPFPRRGPAPGRGAATTATSGVAAFEHVDTSLPN